MAGVISSRFTLVVIVRCQIISNNFAEATNLSCLVSPSDLDVDFTVFPMCPTAHCGHGVELVSTVQNTNGLPLLGNIEVGNKRQQIFVPRRFRERKTP
jgi:hypothetical protein